MVWLGGTDTDFYRPVLRHTPGEQLERFCHFHDQRVLRNLLRGTAPQELGKVRRELLLPRSEGCGETIKVGLAFFDR